MGWFNEIFGPNKHRDIIDISPAREPASQKEAYQLKKVEREWESEWAAEDDPQRIQKAIDRHNKKKRGNTND